MSTVLTIIWRIEFEIAETRHQTQIEGQDLRTRAGNPELKVGLRKPKTLNRELNNKSKHKVVVLA